MTDLQTLSLNYGLPPAFLKSLATLDIALGQRRLAPDAAAAFLTELEKLPPNRLKDVARALNHARLYRGDKPAPAILAWFWAPKSAPYDRRRTIAALDEAPGLEVAFLFSFDGYVREAALNRLRSTNSAIVLTAAATRLNDWAEPVRKAARTCVDALFATAPVVVVAEAALFLLERRASWRRGAEELVSLDAAFARPDVLDALVEVVATHMTGAATRGLVEALRTPLLDSRLLDLAGRAASPSVRSLALRTLIDGEARLRIGFDPRYGLYRRVPLYAHRPTGRAASLDALIALGARDRSAAVRRIAADGLIKHRHTLEAPGALTALFLNDRSPSVRQRAEWLAAELGLELPAASRSKGG